MLFDNVKRLCKQKGITIARLEREVGVGNGSIQKWKKTSPSSDNLKKVADYFDVPVDFLLDRDEIKLSSDSKVFAITYNSLPRTKQELVKQYIKMISAS